MTCYKVQCEKCQAQHAITTVESDRPSIQILGPINADLSAKDAAKMDGEYIVCRCGMSILIKSIVIVQVIQRPT